MSETSNGPALPSVKGSFAQYGAAECDVVRQLETWLQVFSSTRIATLHGHPDMEAEAARLSIPVFMPHPDVEGQHVRARAHHRGIKPRCFTCVECLPLQRGLPSIAGKYSFCFLRLKLF